MARQRIMHGSEVDAATPAEVAQIIAAAFPAQHAHEYRRFKGAIQLNAAGFGQNQVPDDAIYAPPQYDLLLERVSLGGNGALATTVIGIFENQLSDVDLLEVITIGAALKYSDSFSNNIYVTSNSAIIVSVIVAGSPNLQITYNLQGRLVKH